jgi:hypothetical protein
MITHHIALTERHELYLPVPRPLPTGSDLILRRQRAWAQLSDLAETWADGEGLEIEADPFERQAPDGRPAVWGVGFTVTVGRGVESLNSTRRGLPPWVWSDRWQTWRTRFLRLERPHLSAVRGGNVVPLHPDA